MKRYLYFVFVVLCVTHGFLVSLALTQGRPRVFYIWIATAAWFIWPIALWLTSARKWRLAFPLLAGFTALFPAAAMSLMWFFVWAPHIPQWMNAKRFDGHGDAGQFILHTAEDYGAVARTTNGLPRISGQWSYIKYDDGTIEMKLPVQAFPDVQQLLKRSFGPTPYGLVGGWNLEYDLSTNGAVLNVYGGEITDFESTEVSFQRHREGPGM